MHSDALFPASFKPKGAPDILGPSHLPLSDELRPGVLAKRELPQQEGPAAHPRAGPSSFFHLRSIEEGMALRKWALSATLGELEDNIIFSEYMHDIEGAHILRLVMKERTRR